MPDRGEFTLRGADESELDRLLAEYVDRLNAGGELDYTEIEAAHPHVAAELLAKLEAFQGIDLEFPPEEPLGTLGDFTLRRRIGRGGMGVVYEAWENSMDRAVALKVLPAGVAADDRAFQRFMQEARAAGKLSHQNVVPVYSTGVKDGTPWYSMEHVQGETLARILARTKEAQTETETPFGKKDDTRYFGNLADSFADVADGLQHAHSRGVTHRDIKPSNLILDSSGRLRILDFGLARLEGEESITVSGDFVGTLLYTSPEQARRRKIPVDHRTDIYSLGATLYEALTGRPPFRGKDHAETLSQIIERDPAEPRRISPRVPRDLETIVLKCLRKDPGDRYGTAEALGQDLRRFVRGDPIEARPETAVERFSRRVWRHRALATATLFFLVLTTVICGISALLILAEHGRTQLAYEEEKKQRLRAEENFELAREAVDKVLAELARRLASTPGLEPAGRELLGKALEFQQRFLDQKSEDPGVRLDTALAYARVGELNRFLWEPEKALAAFAKAREIVSALIAESPETLSHHEVLARLHAESGRLYSMTGDQSRAEESYRQAVAIQRELASRDPDEAQYRAGLVDRLSALGGVLAMRGQYDEAYRVLGEGERLMLELRSGSPDTVALQEPLALLVTSLESLRRGDVAKARNAYRDAVRQLRAATETEPADAAAELALRDPLAKLLERLGDAFLRRGDLSGARDAKDEAVRQMEVVLNAAPGNSDYLMRLSQYYGELAVVLMRRGDLDEEAVARERALDVARKLIAAHPEGPAFQCRYGDALKDHAAVLGRMGKLEESAKVFGEAIEHARNVLESASEVLCVQWLLARCRVQYAKTLLALDRIEEAEDTLRETLPRWQLLARRAPHVYLDELFLATIQLLDLLEESGRWDEFEVVFEDAQAFLEGILAARDGNEDAVVASDVYQQLARLLTDAPPRFRDPERAVALARAAVDRVSTDGCYWNTLGLAYYRNEQWGEAIDALRRALELGAPCTSGTRFFIARAHAQRGEKSEAEEWYKRGVAWAEEHYRESSWVAQVRAETEELLRDER